MAAYSKALVLESIHDELKAKWDAVEGKYNDVSDDDLEKLARTVAYKVAYNIKNGHMMDKLNDPLIYGNCPAGCSTRI